MTERAGVPDSDADSAAEGPAAPRPGPVAERYALPASPSAANSIAALSSRSPIRVVRRPSQQTAALRQELAAKAAATDELREALDELRHVLDVESAVPAGVGRRGRARLALVTVAVLAVSGIAGYLVVTRDGDEIVHHNGTGAAPARPASAQPSTGRPADRPAADRPASAQPASDQAWPGQAAPTGAPTGAPPGADAVHPLPWPGGVVVVLPGLVTTGPGASVPGTDVQVAVDGDGQHLDVVERLRLDVPTGGPLVLTAPTGAVPALVGDGRAEVSDLQVQLDDQVVPASTEGASGRWTADPPAGLRYVRATLRYRLGNAVVTVTPAAPGRAFGVVTPLGAAISQAHGHDVVVRTLDPHVIGVSCPAAAGTGSMCGSRLADGWSAVVPAGAPAVVLLQIQR